MMKRMGSTPGVLAAALFLAAAGHAAEPQSPVPNKCRMTQLASVDLSGSDIRRLLVPVTMAGHDAWMTLDLAYGLIALYGAAVDDWHLNTFPMANGGRRIEFNGKPVYEMVRQDFAL